MNAPRSPHHRDTFAYLTESGEVVLLEEICHEVAAILEDGGVGMDLPAIAAVIRGARLATEATARGELHPEREAYLAHLKATLRAQRFVMGDGDIEAALRALVGVLSRRDISRVIYTRD